MGWVWQDDDENDKTKSSSSQGDHNLENPTDDDRCSTSKIVRSQCHIEEVEPGKFVRKCQKTEEILRSCIGRPTEVVKSNSEYTEEDVTSEMTKGSLPFNSSSNGEPFSFPGLQSDIDTIEKNLFGGFSKLFEAAEELGSGFFKIFGNPAEGPSVGPSIPPPFSTSRVPVEGPSEAVPRRKQKSEEVALSEFASQVQDV